MLTLIDLGAMFWRNALGGNDPMLGYNQTLDTLRMFRGSRAIVCADSPRSERKAKHETYKAQRKPKPKEALEALDGVIARASEWVPLAQCDGWEADDVVATLTEQSWPERVRIIGSEKDFFVLMSDRVHLVKSDGSSVRVNDCLDKFGVAPSQMTDWLAMVGDAADNVPGCPNCGPDRAAKLLTHFGDLPSVLAAAKDGRLLPSKTIKGIGEATVEALKTWDSSVAVELVTMRSDLPLHLEDYLAWQPSRSPS